MNATLLLQAMNIRAPELTGTVRVHLCRDDLVRQMVPQQAQEWKKKRTFGSPNDFHEHRHASIVSALKSAKEKLSREQIFALIPNIAQATLKNDLTAMRMDDTLQAEWRKGSIKMRGQRYRVYWVK